MGVHNASMSPVRTLAVVLHIHLVSQHAKADAVRGLPGLPPELNHTLNLFAGDLSAGGPNASLFYVLVENATLLNDSHRRQPPPLVLWLQGGPGASSLFGMFNENGPFGIKSTPDNESRELFARENAWTSFASMLYLDQPFGTGFSQPDGGDRSGMQGFVSDELTLREAAVAALDSFVKRHPTYAKRRTFIFGESFAGHMAPNIAFELHRNRSSDGLLLAGLAIGDGWVDPEEQNLSFGPYAYAAGLIDSEQLAQLNIWS